MQAIALVLIGLLGIGCGVFLLIGRKRPRSPENPYVETVADILRTSPPFNRTRLKERFLFEMEPARLLATLRKQQRRSPNYTYCIIVVETFASLSGPYSDAIDETVDWALSDPDILASRAALEGCGFIVDIGTDEDPGHRDLYVRIHLHGSAERAMAMLERGA